MHKQTQRAALMRRENAPVTLASTEAEAWLQRISPTSVHGRVETVGAGWFSPRRRLYNHALLVFRSGTWAIELDGVWRRLEGGSFIIIPPNVSTSYRYVGSGSATQCWSHFDWCYTEKPRPPCSYYSDRWSAVPPEYLRAAPAWVPKHMFTGTVPMPDYVHELFEKLSERCRSLDPLLQLTARGVLLEILLLLLAPPDSTRAHDRQSKIRNAVYDLREKLDHASTCPIGAPPSLERLVADSGFSCGHLSRAFKQSFGISSGEYVMRRRLHQARRLLLETRLPIGEICQLAGFGYFSHFSRQFKRHVGVSPSEYRRSSEMASTQ